jgi:hypothetical protein
MLARRLDEAGGATATAAAEPAPAEQAPAAEGTTGTDGSKSVETSDSTDAPEAAVGATHAGSGTADAAEIEGVTDDANDASEPVGTTADVTGAAPRSDASEAPSPPTEGSDTTGEQPQTGENPDAEDGTAETATVDMEDAAAAGTEAADAGDEPSWVSSMPEAPALVLKNQSDILLEPRIRCRCDGDVVFLDDIRIESGETYRWADLPEEGPVYVDVLFSHGSRAAEQVPEDALRPGPVGIDLHASGSEIRTRE